MSRGQGSGFVKRQSAPDAKSADTEAEPSAVCPTCKGEMWVCENHPDVPWDGGDQNCCGGAGAPCPRCNPCDENTPPKMPPGTTIIGDRERGILQ